ncbi:MAG: hypothetical protein FJ225_04830 [Lentisphaerae bacterium]|nr:hypothetical protein [Lentisphaerota bacterium]
MSAVNEWVAREYFEAIGFLVSQPCKFVVPGRHKTAEEEIDLLVFNPAATEHRVPEEIVWETRHLSTVARAVVGVRGWHTERLYVSRIEKSPEVLRFVESEPVRLASGRLGTESVARVLCLPALPASGEMKKNVVRVLREKGIDGVISFRTMLLELVSRVETHRNYDKSDLLQVIRLLKNYGLLRDPQMELFGRRRRRARG